MFIISQIALPDNTYIFIRAKISYVILMVQN